MHKDFQELSALAATGQITREERDRLDRHTLECAECRDFLNDLTRLKARVAPVVAASRAESSNPPPGIRERFLLRAAAAGLEMRAGAPVAGMAEALPRYAPFAAPQAEKPGRGWAWVFGPAFLRVALPVTACLFCGFLGYFLAQQRAAELPAPEVAMKVTRTPWQIPVPPLVQAPSLGDAARAERIQQLERERLDSEARLETLTTDLQRTQAEAARLSRDLAVASEQASGRGRLEGQFKAETLRVQNAEDRIRQLLADLNAERDRRRRLELAALQPGNNPKPNTRITELEEELARERDAKSARGDFAELISARNLHIVDVYDTASNGQRQRPFGRVFYVEGRSLVFYAYDLASQSRANATVAFHVWGEKASVKSTTYNLGILRGDGEGQSRWVLAFDDPRILKSINAVYVTAELGNSENHEPRGRKFMYAFLGSANHP